MFPDEHGYAVEAAAAPDSDTILRTTNGGRTWHKPGVDGAPHLIDRMFFLGRTLGWIAGVSPHDGSREVTLLRTTGNDNGWIAVSRFDGGRHVFEAGYLWFLDATHGWLVLRYDDDNGTRLLHTEDGGLHWTFYPIDAFPDQGPGRWITFVQFADLRRGFAFASKSEGAGGDLLSTTDGSLHWHSATLSDRIANCQARNGALQCGSYRAGLDPSQIGILTIIPRQ